MIVKKRTFEAAKFPKGSVERERLNKSALTSEYMTSYRYMIWSETGGSIYSFRTKAEAVAKLEQIEAIEKLKEAQ